MGESDVNTSPSTPAVTGGGRPWPRPKRLPREQWAIGLTLGAGVMFCITLFYMVGSPAPFPIFLTVLLLLLFLVFLAMASGLSKGSEWARLEFIEWRECPACREPLDGLPDEGACPRCSMAYDRAWLKSVWTNAYAPSEMADRRRSMEHRGLFPGRGPKRTVRPSITRGWMVGAAWAVVVVGQGLLVWTQLTFGPVTFIGHLLAGNLPIGVAIGLTAGWRQWRRLSRPIALGFRQCSACGFDLRGLEEPGVCPECRKGFTDRWLRSWWICTGRIPARWDLVWIREHYFIQHPEERSSEDIEV